MAWYKVVSRTPINIDHGNGAVIAYPKGAIFEADHRLRDIALAFRGMKKLYPLGQTLPSTLTGQGIPAPGPSTKPPTQIEKKNKKDLPRVTYRGRSHQISDIISVSK